MHYFGLLCELLICIEFKLQHLITDI